MLLLSFLFYTWNGISLPVDCGKLKMNLQHLKQLQNTKETYVKKGDEMELWKILRKSKRRQ